MTSTATTALFARLYLRGDVEDAANECATHGAHLDAVDPDLGGIVDAVKVEPDVAALVGLGNIDDSAIPVRGMCKAFGDDLGAVVFAVERLGIDVVVDQRSEHGAGNRRRVPATCAEARRRNLRSGLRHLGYVLQLPARIENDRLRNCRSRGSCSAKTARISTKDEM